MLPARPVRSLAVLVGLGLLLGWAGFACVARESRDAAGATPFTLAQFGAAGDGRTDDTAALTKAFAQAAGRCIDGQGREYRVVGSVTVSNDLCLLDTRLRQDTPKFDTGPLIRGTCPSVRDPEALVPCGDPAIAGDLPAGLTRYLYTRTLMIRRPEGARPLTVTLRRVRVDRGTDPASGARSDAAAIWLVGAGKAVLEDVEITGGGKGFGLILIDSSDVTLKRLNIHDMVWAPYAGDVPLDLANVKRQGWNSTTIREFRKAGDRGAGHSGFYGVRVQEQVSCLMIVRSHRVAIEGLRIRGCRARFAQGDLPWQADGAGIGDSSTRVTISHGSLVEDTWEGIDVVGGGTGVSDVTVADTTVNNSFGYGIKVGYNVSGMVVRNARVNAAGLAGIVLYGPLKRPRVSGARITGVGSVRLGGEVASPWGQERAGVLVEPGANDGAPQDVVLSGIRVDGGAHCRYGLLNLSGRAIALSGARFAGCVADTSDRKLP